VKRALAAVALSLLLPAAAGASADLYRLDIEGSGKIALARPAQDGELAIEIPADFHGTLNLVSHNGAWRARDADIEVTVLGQTLRLRLGPDLWPRSGGPLWWLSPEALGPQVSVEVNGTPAGWGSAGDLAAVPLLGAPLTVGQQAGREESAWRIEFEPVTEEETPALSAVLRPPGGEAMLRFQVSLTTLRSSASLRSTSGAQGPSAHTRPWSASGRLGPVELPGPDEARFVLHRLAWNARGEVALPFGLRSPASQGVVASAAPRTLTASVTVDARFDGPGGMRADLTAKAEAALAPPAEQP